MSQYTTRSNEEEIVCENEQNEHTQQRENSPNSESGTQQREIDHTHIDLNALWVVRRLQAHDYQAYLTGGCVRDLLLGKTPKDFDVATSAKPAEIRSVFSNSRLIGRRFLLVHVCFPGGRVIETATFRSTPNNVDGEDLLVRRDNAYGSLEEDAMRRDLTINGLFYDPVSKRLIDFVGGQKDLIKGIIRSIGNPDVRMQEDPVRMIRAIKFACRLEFDIEPETLSAIRNHAPDIVRCAPARLQEELLGLLRSKQAKSCMLTCQKLGILDALLPELIEGLNCSLPARKENDTDAVSTSQRLQHWHGMLQALDAACHRNAQIEAAVVFAAMLLPVYLALAQSGRNPTSWLDHICMQWAKRIRLVRRDQDVIRMLLSCMTNVFLQDKLTDDTIKNTVRKPYFVQTLLLYILHLHAQGESLEPVKKWKKFAHNAGKSYIQIRKASSQGKSHSDES